MTVFLRLFVSMFLLTLIFQPVVFAHEKNQVLVRIIAGPAYEVSGSVVAEDNATALSVLQKFASQNKISLKLKDTAYGPYVVQIDSLAEKMNTATSGWSFWVNGRSSEMGADQTIVKADDEVVWSISDWGSTLYPKVNFSLSDEQLAESQVELNQPFVVTVTAEKTTYDENWNASTSTIAVPNATLDVLSADGRATYKTDAKGNVQLVRSTYSPFAIRVSQFDAVSKVPTLVPSQTKWFTINHIQNNWDDVSKTHWALPCIQFVTSNGYFPAKTASQFAPNGHVKINEAIQALALIKGYASQSNWDDVASKLGWSDKDHVFSKNKAVTREQMAYLVSKVIGVSTSGDKQKTWKDQKQFTKDPAILNAVQAVTAKGAINGYRDGNFRPQKPISRAEFSHVIMYMVEMLKVHKH